MNAPDPWPIIGFRNARGEWEEGPFDPNNLHHIAMMMELTCECPECRAWLETVLPGGGPPRSRPSANRRAREPSSRAERNRRRRWRQGLGKRKA